MKETCVCREALKQIADLLWPPEDPEHQWSPDTIESIAEIVQATLESKCEHSE